MLSCAQDDSDCFDTIEPTLKRLLPFPWIAVKAEGGVNVLLLSRTEEKAIQRRAYFSWCGEEKVTVHCKAVPAILLDSILQNSECNEVIHKEKKLFNLVQRILTVIQRLQSYEVCVGLDETDYKPLWDLEKFGEIDKNPYKELRYKETFRPFACHLLVSTSGHIKRRCPVCTQTKVNFRAKIGRHRSSLSRPSTANVHLDRNQLIKKVQIQQKKFKHSQAQIYKLKKDLQKATALKSVHSDDSVSEELVKICMAYVDCNTLEPR